jgi:hypothetical protein
MGATARSGLCLLAACLLAGCAHLGRTSSPAGIDHVVFVWLKNPDSTRDRHILVEKSQELAATIPQTRSFRWGTPVPSERPVVDDTYDLALVMNFDDRAGLEAYENHPAHKRAAKEVLRPLARKIVVYDIERN